MCMGTKRTVRKVEMIVQDSSLRRKRFRLVSEQRKTEEGDSRLWSHEKWNERHFDSRSPFFAPKPHGNACYAGYQDRGVARGIWVATDLPFERGVLFFNKNVENWT